MTAFLRIPAVPPSPTGGLQVGRPEMLVNLAALSMAKWLPEHQGGELWLIVSESETIKVKGAAAAALWERLQALEAPAPRPTLSAWIDPPSEAEARRRVVAQLAGDAAARAQVGVIAPGIVQRLARLGQELDDVGAALFEAPQTAAPAGGLPLEEARGLATQVREAAAAGWGGAAPSPAAGTAKGLDADGAGGKP